MFLFLVIFFLVVFFVLRRFSYGYREKMLSREVDYLEAKNKLDVIAYKMEEKLCAEEFKIGTPCHDIWFPIVNRSRYAESYFSMTSFLKYHLLPTYRKKMLKDIELMELEVKKMRPDMRKLYDEYSAALFEAFKLRHRGIFSLMIIFFVLRHLPTIFREISNLREVKPPANLPEDIVNFQLVA